MPRTQIRNIAIIAHVDHGKTTLIDGMLKQARIFRENQELADRILDSNDLERERGITILAKNTAISLRDEVSGEDVKINIVDTPGHADFGGEVERVLNMVDGVLLLVDAAEGPMPQTRFVLKHALRLGHQAVVVINKIDRKGAEPIKALNQTFDLFIQLGASDRQADFPVIYTNAVAGLAGETPELGQDLQPLFNAILQHLPPPEGDPEAPFQMLVTSIGYDPYRGATATGRISSGGIRRDMPILRIKPSGESVEDIAQYLYTFDGLEKREIDSAEAGEIIVIAGLEDIAIGETLSDPELPQALPAISVEEPTVRMTFGVNSSPFQGREGTDSTSRKLRERLFNELRTNVALRVEETKSAEKFVVSGRGELHLAILMENMRREGFEFEVSRPEVILHSDDGGVYEPYEEVYIETSRAALGTVVEILGSRQGKMLDIQDQAEETVRLRYLVPTRGLLGFRHRFLTATRGAGFLHSVFHAYLPLSNGSITRSQGSLVAWEPGITTTYGLKNAEERGQLFIGPGVEVYEGMVIGEHQRPGDLAVNVCKKRHVTNHRASFKEIDDRLTPPREMSLDEAIEYLGEDELLEITPKSLRIRKRMLDTRQREKEIKRTKEALNA
ncbi:MAG: translational GTPase TypA, partial [Anaerolineales bacterium]|jgi:GTP-binding protein